MKKLVKYFIVPAMFMAMCTQAAAGPSWSYHSQTLGATLTVWPTVDCVAYDHEFQGHVEHGDVRSGQLSSWPNDYMWEIIQDGTGYRINGKKTSPRYDSGLGQWVLDPFAEWVADNADEGHPIVLAHIGDTTGSYPDVYLVVNLNEWLADPRPVQETYTVTDGTCPDLPGYLIGTTPITFHPERGSGENPFSTTVLTGTVELEGEISLTPEPATLGLLLVGGLALLRGCKR